MRIPPNHPSRDAIEIYKLAKDPRFRLEDLQGGSALLHNAMLGNLEALELLQFRLQRQYAKYITSNDPFFASYPVKDSLPALERGMIPLCLMPTGDWLALPSLKHLTLNLGLFGRIGGGKSSWLRGFNASVVNAGGAVIGFDLKGKAEMVDSAVLMKQHRVHVWNWNEVPLPILNPPDDKISVRQWANVVSGFLGAEWSLIASNTALEEILQSFYGKSHLKTWNRLISEAESFKPDSRRSAEYRDVILRNLRATYAALGETVNVVKGDVIQRMAQDKGGCHIILLNGLPVRVASFLCAAYVILVYEYRLANPSTQEDVVVFVLDDSMTLMREKRQGADNSIHPLDTISFTARSLDISLVPTLQNINECSRYFLLNCQTILIAGGCHGEDAEIVARLAHLDNAQKAYLSMMLPGEVFALAWSVHPVAVRGFYPLIS